MVEIAVSVLVVVGVLLALAAGIGLQHLPDTFARMHAATKPATVGLMVVLVAAALRVGSYAGQAKLLLVVILQLVTAPVAMHMLGRAAYWGGVRLSDRTEVDELGRDDGRSPPGSEDRPGPGRPGET